MALIESFHTLIIEAHDGGKPAEAVVEIELIEDANPHAAFRKSYDITARGVITIANLPPPSSGTLRLTSGDRVITRPVTAIASGNH